MTLFLGTILALGMILSCANALAEEGDNAPQPKIKERAENNYTAQEPAGALERPRDRTSRDDDSLDKLADASGEQNEDALQTQQQLQERKQLKLQDEAGDQLQLKEQTRERIQNRIELNINEDANLSDQARQRMRQTLRECLELGADPEHLEAVFPGGTGRSQLDEATMLQLQERVRAMLRTGMPTDVVLEKVQEGQMKGADGGRLEQVMARMQHHVEYAYRWMRGVEEDGAAGHPDPAAENQLVRGVALDLWRGLGEGDLDQLRDRVRLRLQDGSCSVTDAAAAAETATQLRELGVDAKRAMNLAGDALQQGYMAREMRQLAYMVMAAHKRGGSADEVLAHLEDGVQNGEPLGQMTQQMLQWGWMGPAEDGGHGPGPMGPVDGVIGGGNQPDVPGIGDGGDGGLGGEDPGNTDPGQGSGSGQGAGQGSGQGGRG